MVDLGFELMSGDSKDHTRLLHDKLVFIFPRRNDTLCSFAVDLIIIINKTEADYLIIY